MGTFADSFLPAITGDLAQAGPSMIQGQMQGMNAARQLAMLDLQLKNQQIQNEMLQRPQPLTLTPGSMFGTRHPLTGQVNIMGQVPLGAHNLHPSEIEKNQALAEEAKSKATYYGSGVGPGMTSDQRNAAGLGMSLEDYLAQYRQGMTQTTDQRNAAAMGLTLPEYFKQKQQLKLDPDAALSPQALDFMARQALAGDTSVYQNLGRGMQGARNLVLLREKVQQLASGQKISPAELSTRGAEYQGLKAGERVLGGRTATFGMAVNEAMQMADLVTQASKNFPRGQYPLANIALRSYETQTGDPNVVKFGAALNSFINAYARAISPTGVPTVADKEHARQMLNTTQTDEQVNAVIQQLKLEMEAAGRAPGMVRQEFRKGMMGTEPPVKPPATRQGQTPYTPGSYPPPAGAIQRGYRFKGGDPSKKENWEPVK